MIIFFIFLPDHSFIERCSPGSLAENAGLKRAGISTESENRGEDYMHQSGMIFAHLG
jgi:hypothetical protein